MKIYLTDIKLTDKQIKELLKTAIVLVDTREQENTHIIEWFEKKKKPYKIKKLDYGDYGMLLPKSELIPFDIQLPFAIERKGSLNELSGNFAQDRTRLENEFIRAKGKMALIIENASIDDILEENYRTKLGSTAFIASLLSFYSKYDVLYTFCEKCHTASIMYAILYYKMRNKLKGE